MDARDRLITALYAQLRRNVKHTRPSSGSSAMAGFQTRSLKQSQVTRFLLSPAKTWQRLKRSSRSTAAERRPSARPKRSSGGKDVHHG